MIELYCKNQNDETNHDDISNHYSTYDEHDSNYEDNDVHHHVYQCIYIYISIGMHIDIYCHTFVCGVEHANQLTMCTKSPLCLR